MRRQLVLLFMVVACVAADWKTQSYAEWSDSTILKLLTDSAWARPRRVDLTWMQKQEQPFSYKDVPGADPTPRPTPGSPVGGIGKPKSKIPDEADIVVRWASALPVRQAAAVYRARDEKAGALKREEWVGATPSEYIVEVMGIPAEVAHKGVDSIAAILQSSMVLESKTGRRWKPARAVVTNLGTTLKILVYFPKTNPIVLADKEITCTADVQIFHIREVFKLSSMTRQGNLEL